MRIDIAQNSSEWTAWRSTGIGGSDIGTILGINKYKSCEQLLKEKIGLTQPEDLSENQHIIRGHKLEPEARTYAQVMLDEIFEPMCFQHDKWTYLLSSLDGISTCGKRALEIKCPAKKNHEMAAMGFLSASYYAQCQHNMFVSGAEEIHFVSFNPKMENNYVSFPIYPNIDFLYEYMPRVGDFWDAVLAKEIIEIQPLDFGGEYLNPQTGELL